MRGVNPRTNLKAVVNTRRGLKGATTLPKAYLAAGVATMGAMTYLVLRDGSSGARKEQQQQPPPPPSAAASSSSNAAAPFLTLDGQAVSAANVPKYVLANSGLDQEQKLQVALCRRQAWLRASQYAPMAALWSYAACVLTEHSGLAAAAREPHGRAARRGGDWRHAWRLPWRPRGQADDECGADGDAD